MKGDSYVNMTRFGNGSGFVVIKSEVSPMGGRTGRSCDWGISDVGKTYWLKTALHYTGRVIYYVKLNNSRRLGKGSFWLIPDVRRLSEVLFTKNKDCASARYCRRAVFLACVTVKINPLLCRGEDRSLDISMNSCAKIKVGLQNHK